LTPFSRSLHSRVGFRHAAERCTDGDATTLSSATTRTAKDGMADDAVSFLSGRLGGGGTVGARWKRPLFHLAAWLARITGTAVLRTGARQPAVTTMPWWVDHYVSTAVAVMSRAGGARRFPAECSVDCDNPKRRL
jgi:hypothetical protein